MDDWAVATGDQYVTDMNERYPVFDAPRSYERAIVAAAPVREGTISLRDPSMSKMGSYEKLFRNDQFQRPAVMTCDKCRHGCADAYVVAKKSKPRVTAAKAGGRMEAAASGAVSMESLKIDSNVLLFMFMFVVIVFICCYYTKAISELKTQLKLLRQMMQK